MKEPLFTLGPKITPPPGLRGDRIDPCLAFPVPFWLKGFLPPPLTSALVFVFALPCLAMGKKVTAGVKLWGQQL